MQLYLDRYLTDCIVPGNRITVIGIYSIRKTGTKPQKVRDRGGGGGVRGVLLLLLQNRGEKMSSAGLRKPYLRVVGIEIDSDGSGRSSGRPLTSEDEEEFRRLASRPDVYEMVAR